MKPSHKHKQLLLVAIVLFCQRTPIRFWRLVKWAKTHRSEWRSSRTTKNFRWVKLGPRDASWRHRSSAAWRHEFVASVTSLNYHFRVKDSDDLTSIDNSVLFAGFPDWRVVVLSYKVHACFSATCWFNEDKLRRELPRNNSEADRSGYLSICLLHDGIRLRMCTVEFTLRRARQSVPLYTPLFNLTFFCQFFLNQFCVNDELQWIL